jgi:hypothetical protein
VRRTFGYAATTKDAAQRSIRTFYEAVKFIHHQKMTISGISSSSNTYQTSSSNFNQIKQDFQLLNQALKSGDLSDAQQAFVQLQKDGGTRQSTSK